MSRGNKLATFLATVALTSTAFAEGVDPSAAKLVDFGGGWAITNSMFTGWMISALLVTFVLFLVGKPTILPGKGQAVIESLIEALRDLFEPIVGKKAFPLAFPILVTFFIFILFHNWMGLIPGVGTMGWGTTDAAGHFHITRPLIRPHNSDFNGTIALALISFGAWAIIVFKIAGTKLILWDLFGNKADKKETPGWLYPILLAWFSLSSASSKFSRSLSARSRFRSVFLATSSAGKICSTAPVSSSCSISWSCSSASFRPSCFTLLTSVYIGLLCNHEGSRRSRP
jgi:F-type H+-transporting ATPase subunit a